MESDIYDLLQKVSFEPEKLKQLSIADLIAIYNSTDNAYSLKGVKNQVLTALKYHFENLNT